MTSKTTALTPVCIAGLARQVLELSDPPSTSTVAELKTYARVATSFLVNKVDANLLKPFLDAIDEKIEAFGASRTHWAVEFIGATRLYPPLPNISFLKPDADVRLSGNN